MDSRRVITFANTNDQISFRHHVYKKKGHKDIEMKEVLFMAVKKIYEICNIRWDLASK